MVGVVPRGKHNRATSPKRLVSLHSVGLGRAESFLRPSTLPDPLPDNCDLPRVRGRGEALAAMLPGPPKGVCVGMATRATLLWGHEDANALLMQVLTPWGKHHVLAAHAP